MLLMDVLSSNTDCSNVWFIVPVFHWVLMYLLSIRIATMLQNKSTNPMCKTTLIVAPLALLDQWKTEIETKTNCGLACLIYHGK